MDQRSETNKKIQLGVIRTWYTINAITEQHQHCEIEILNGTNLLKLKLKRKWKWKWTHSDLMLDAVSLIRLYFSV